MEKVLFHVEPRMGGGGERFHVEHGVAHGCYFSHGLHGWTRIAAYRGVAMDMFWNKAESADDPGLLACPAGWMQVIRAGI